MPMNNRSMTIAASAVSAGRTAQTRAIPRAISRTMRAGAMISEKGFPMMAYPSTCRANTPGVSPLAIPEIRKTPPSRIRPRCPAMRRIPLGPVVDEPGVQDSVRVVMFLQAADLVPMRPEMLLPARTIELDESGEITLGAGRDAHV